MNRYYLSDPNPNPNPPTTTNNHAPTHPHATATTATTSTTHPRTPFHPHAPRLEVCIQAHTTTARKTVGVFTPVSLPVTCVHLHEKEKLVNSDRFFLREVDGRLRRTDTPGVTPSLRTGERSPGAFGPRAVGRALRKAEEPPPQKVTVGKPAAFFLPTLICPRKIIISLFLEITRCPTSGRSRKQSPACRL